MMDEEKKKKKDDYVTCGQRVEYFKRSREDGGDRVK